MACDLTINDELWKAASLAANLLGLDAAPSRVLVAKPQGTGLTLAFAGRVAPTFFGPILPTNDMGKEARQAINAIFREVERPDRMISFLDRQRDLPLGREWVLVDDKFNELDVGGQKVIVPFDR